MPGPRRVISAVQADEILEKYNAGTNLKDLAEQYNTSPMTISRTISRNGGNTRGGGRPSMYTDEQIKQMRKEYEAGATLRELSDIYGGHYSNIGQAIKRAGGNFAVFSAGSTRKDAYL